MVVLLNNKGVFMMNRKIAKRCFCYKKRYWYRNLAMIPEYFRQVRFLKKHGYDISAQWSTFSWFIDTMRSILTNYKENRQGHPIGKTDEEWGQTIEEMLALLDKMDENTFDWYDKDVVVMIEKVKKMEESKDDFFKIFAKEFYDLWD